MFLVLRHVRYLLAVAEHKSFTRAADALHVSQPTLSQQIKQLEDFLGAQLLDRSGRGVRLTDAGEAYLSYARNAMTSLEAGQRAIHDVGNLSRGILRLGITPVFSYSMASLILNKFRDEYPGIKLNVHEASQELIEIDLMNDLLDIGIVFDDTISTGTMFSDEFETVKLCTQVPSVIVDYTHPLAKDDGRLSLTQLRDLELALLPPTFALRRHVDGYYRKHGLRPAVAFESNSIALIVEAIRPGKLATFFGRDIMRTKPGLVAIELDPALPERNVVFLRRRAAYQSAACKAFAKLVTGWCNDLNRGCDPEDRGEPSKI